MREITPLLAEQKEHLQKVMDLQKQIQDKIEACASMQSPQLPKRLRTSCEVYPIGNLPQPKAKSRFARWFSPS